MSVIFSYAYMWAARAFTKQFIWITGILNIVFGFVTAIYMLSRKYWSGGIVFLLFSVFYVFCFISWIPRIPFSVLMLQTSIDVSKKYGHTYVVSLIGGLLAAALGAWYSVTLVSIYVQYTPNGGNNNCRNGVGDCGSGKVIGLLVFVTFAMYWISEYALTIDPIVLRPTNSTQMAQEHDPRYNLWCIRQLVFRTKRNAQRCNTRCIQASRHLQFRQYQSWKLARSYHPVPASDLLGRSAQRFS
jgi:hypothetical protein